MTPRQLALAVGGLLICLFLAAIDASIVNTALPRIATELHGFDLYAWVTTGYLLSSTAVVPVAGKLGDRYGRRLLLVGGVIYFLIITALCGLAQDMPQLIGLRTLQGIGAGVLLASIFSSLGELLTPVARARMSGLITATFSAANVLGPVVGGFLTDAFTWRAVFYANLPFGVLALIALWRAFPAIRHAADQRLPIDVWGAVTITLATVLLLLALGWGGHEFAWDSPPLLGTLAAAAIVLALFIAIEARAVDPVVPLGLFRDNVIALTSLGSLLHQMSMFGAALFIPLFVQGVLGQSAMLSGGLLAPMVAAMLITNIGAGLAIAQFGRYRAFILAGFAISTAGFLMLASSTSSTSFPFLIVTMVVLGLGSGCLVGTLNLASQNAAPLSQMGVVTAFAQFSRAMGGTLGSAVLGSILLLQLGPRTQLADLAELRQPLTDALHWVFLASAAFVALGLLASLFLAERPMRRRRTLGDQSGGASPTPCEPYRPPAPASGAPRQQ
ncbi:MAG TPA: MDR family MFS transporter [Chloroflexota bacterium]|nr:MDR family MFS transporter [Chloroflexota bacterium]